MHPETIKRHKKCYIETLLYLIVGLVVILGTLGLMFYRIIVVSNNIADNWGYALLLIGVALVDLGIVGYGIYGIIYCVKNVKKLNKMLKEKL